MTDWLDTYRADQLAEADRLNAIDRTLAKSPWGRSAPLAPLFALVGDAAGVALLFGMLWAGLTLNANAAVAMVALYGAGVAIYAAVGALK